jgi:hypothetical protein
MHRDDEHSSFRMDKNQVRTRLTNPSISLLAQKAKKLGGFRHLING